MGGGAYQEVAEAWARASAHGVYSWLWGKTTSHWADTYDSHGPKFASAHANGGGTTFIVDGPVGEMVQLIARIPATGTVADPTYSPLKDAPSQGMYCDSIFDSQFSVNVAVLWSGTQSLLSGSATLWGPEAANPGLTLTGDLAGSHFNVSDITSPSGEARKQAVVGTDIVSLAPVMVPTNTPFDTIFDLSAGGGDEIVTTDGRTLGNASDFVVQLELLDHSDAYTLRALPEPSTLILLGAVGWRRWATAGIAADGWRSAAAGRLRDVDCSCRRRLPVADPEGEFLTVVDGASRAQRRACHREELRAGSL